MRISGSVQFSIDDIMLNIPKWGVGAYMRKVDMYQDIDYDIVLVIGTESGNTSSLSIWVLWVTLIWVH